MSGGAAPGLYERKMNIDEIIKWLEEKKYDYNISKEDEAYNHYTFDKDSKVEVIETIGTTNSDITFNIPKTYKRLDEKEELLKKCIKQAIKLGRPYMKKYDYDSEDKPTQQEWELALVIFNHRINGGAN